MRFKTEGRKMRQRRSTSYMKINSRCYHWATSQKVAGSIPDVIGIFHSLLPAGLWPCGLLSF